MMDKWVKINRMTQSSNGYVMLANMLQVYHLHKQYFLKIVEVKDFFEWLYISFVLFII